MKLEDRTARINKEFYNFLKKIEDLRISAGLDKKKIGLNSLTFLLTKHDSWNEIIQDLINVNAKGLKNE